MRKENTGRRDARGSHSKDDRGPARKKPTQKPLQRYAVADKSEPGWTKPDGKPLRKRAGKKVDEPKSFERKRPSREIGTGRGSERDFKPKRSNFSADRGKDDFKPSRSREDKPFRKSGDDFKSESSRDDKSFGKRDDFNPRAPRGDKPFSKPDRDFKKDDDFKPKRRNFSEERGKGDFNSSRNMEDKSFRKRDDDFKPRVSRSEKSFDRPARDFKNDDDRPKRRDFSAERGKSDFKDSRSRDEKPFRTRDNEERPARREYTSRDKKERPPRGKSFLKSGTPDEKPFKRFEKDFSREEKRTDKFKLRARPSATRRDRDDIPAEKSTSADGTIRLNRYIANAGICSRREADDYISAGLVTVNGEIVSEVGTKVLPTDDVRYNGERLKAEKNVYILLNKPKDYITTSDDPDGRKTVMELIAKACKERVYPVGRLDRSTTGVLLFTNDGDLAKKLTHPSSNIRKVYHVELDKTLKKNDMQAMLDGLELEDGRSAVDDISYDAGGDKKQVGVELHSGKNRIVRRMFEQLGYEVRKLDRVVFAGLTKKDLPRGRWRILAETEVGILKMQVGKASKKGVKGEKDKDQLKLF